MEDENEEPILAAPTDLLKKELVISLSTIDAHDMELALATGDTSSIETDENKLDQKDNNLNIERRTSLLNNPNYGVILSFLDKFRSNLDVQDYPLYLLEENLISDEENISRRLIDFHFLLLKRLSLAKGAQREKFVAIITKFAYRFDVDDGEHLKDNGYSQAQVDVKVRILKNLLETQFDHNQPFKVSLQDKTSLDIRAQPFGRDRFGTSYWLFLDSECFVRLFREDVDDNRSWTNLAKDHDEFEKFVKIIISDQVFRKKFPDWKCTHEPLALLTPSNEFEQRYRSITCIIKEQELENKKQPSPSREPIKPDSDSIKESKISPNSSPRIILKQEGKVELTKSEISDPESTSSVDKIEERSRITSSNETTATTGSSQTIDEENIQHHSKKSRSRRKTGSWSKKKKRHTTKKETSADEQQTTPSRRGRKRKRILNDDDDEEGVIQEKENKQEIENNLEKENNEETQPTVDEESTMNDDLPIALRRSRRIRKVPTIELTPSKSSPIKSFSQTPKKNKFVNGKHKSSKRGRRGRGKNSRGDLDLSSTSSDDHIPSEDEDNSEDDNPNKSSDELIEEDLLEEEDEFVPRRSAKTVAKRRGQLIAENDDQVMPSSSACCTCSKTDRPEALLLCDDCDDAYHLECLKPSLISVPDGDWYCPLCEQKRLCNNLVEKLIILIKEHKELESKRNQCISKRTNRLANVMANLDRMVKRSTKKRRPNGGVVYSDEDNDDENEEPPEEEPEEEKEDDDDDDDDSVYGFKDGRTVRKSDENRRSSSTSPRRMGWKHTSDEQTSTGKLGVRACRRKAQDYRFDDYEKRIKEAMIDGGVKGEEIEKDSDDSDDEKDDEDDDGTRRSPKKRARYEKDEDFDDSDAKQDREFAPDQNRTTDEEDSEEQESEDDASEDNGWSGKRRSSPKKKSKSTGGGGSRRKGKRKSRSDDFISDGDFDDAINNDNNNNSNVKSDGDDDLDLNQILADDRRRPARAAATASRNYAKQQANDDDEDDYEPPRRATRMRRKRHGSDDSFVDDDDDYEKIARRREQVNFERTRTSITDHIKKLVNDPEDEDEPAATTEDKRRDSLSRGGDDGEDPMVKQGQSKVPPVTEPVEAQPSDEDDDFPDEQEILKTQSLLKKLKNNSNGPATVVKKSAPAAVRPAFMPPMHSYQHAMIDPTAHFAFIRPASTTAPPSTPMNNGHHSPPPVIINGHGGPQASSTTEPSDLGKVNGDHSPSSGERDSFMIGSLLKETSN